MQGEAGLVLGKRTAGCYKWLLYWRWKSSNCPSSYAFKTMCALVEFTEPGVAEIESMKSFPLISRSVALMPERETGHILSRSNSLICFHMHQISNTLLHFCEETKPNQHSKIFLSLFTSSVSGLVYFVQKSMSSSKMFCAKSCVLT